MSDADLIKRAAEGNNAALIEATEKFLSKEVALATVKYVCSRLRFFYVESDFDFILKNRHLVVYEAAKTWVPGKLLFARWVNLKVNNDIRHFATKIYRRKSLYKKFEQDINERLLPPSIHYDTEDDPL